MGSDLSIPVVNTNELELVIDVLISVSPGLESLLSRECVIVYPEELFLLLRNKLFRPLSLSSAYVAERRNSSSCSALE